MSLVHDTEHVVPLLDDAVVDELDAAVDELDAAVDELDELVDVVPLDDELDELVVPPMHCSGGLSPGAVPPGGGTQS